MMSENNDRPLLRLKGITKVFPGVKALDGVDFDLRAGEIHSLVGENGAGKSTLINIISGLFRPDAGEFFIGDEKVVLQNAREAFERGIGVVHQERNLIPTFTIAENICFDEVSKRSLSRIDNRRLSENAKRALEIVELDLDPNAPITFLSAAQQQMIEIARSLSLNSRILLLDEPTSSISASEVDLLVNIIRKLKAQGVGIIYISHKLEEVYELADRITVLRDGRKLGESMAPKDLTRDDLIERMVGRKEAVIPFPERGVKDEYAMEAREIRGRKNTHVNSFGLKKGEILGWYGLVGSGRSELARMIIGVDRIVGGKLFVSGREAHIRNSRDAFRKYGIYYLSEDRKGEGLFLMHSVAGNISVVALDKILKNRLISMNIEHRVAEKYIHELSIKTPSDAQSVGNLSGGNQQKVCIAKGLFINSDIIIIDEPTVGIDIKTKWEIHKLIYDLGESGKSIILISSDLSEMVRLADRILVFNSGTVCADMHNTKNYVEVSNKIMDFIIEDSVG